MEDQIERAVGDTTIESYWLSRKAEREALAKEKDERALVMLGKACEFYDKNYPNSTHGIEYGEAKGKLPTASFELKREEAILLRRVLEYYKTENILTPEDVVKIGHAVWRVNENISDLSRLNQILELEKKKKEMEKEIHRLKTLKAEIPQKIKEVELHFVCQWCNKEFVGETARAEIKEHISKCPKSPTAPEEPPVKEEIPEKLFTCQVCGIQLKRNEMKDHAWKCKKITEEPKIEESPKEVSYICEVCGKDCKNGAGFASHIKTHEKEEDK